MDLREIKLNARKKFSRYIRGVLVGLVSVFFKHDVVVLNLLQYCMDASFTCFVVGVLIVSF